MRTQSLLLTILAAGLALSACSNTKNQSMSDNPLFTESTLTFEAPNFDAITVEHYRPAFEAGMKQELEEIEQIVSNTEAPTFENTIVAMEKSGQLLSRTASVFYNLTSAHTNEEIQAIQKDMAPKLAAHSDDILLNPALYDRVKTLYDKRDELDLTEAEMKLLEDTHRDFVRAGAQLSEDEQQRMREINERLSSLTTEFQENLLALTKERSVLVKDKAELDGLSDDRIAAAKEAADEQDADAGGEAGADIDIDAGPVDVDVEGSLDTAVDGN